MCALRRAHTPPASPARVSVQKRVHFAKNSARTKSFCSVLFFVVKSFQPWLCLEVLTFSACDHAVSSSSACWWLVGGRGGWPATRALVLVNMCTRAVLAGCRPVAHAQILPGGVCVASVIVCVSVKARPTRCRPRRWCGACDAQGVRRCLTERCDAAARCSSRH